MRPAAVGETCSAAVPCVEGLICQTGTCAAFGARLELGAPCFIDTQCGFKVFEGPLARQLFSEATLEGFLFDLDITLLAQSQGHKVCEFPIEWTCDLDSRLSANRHTAEILREIRELWRKYRKSRPKAGK